MYSLYVDEVSLGENLAQYDFDLFELRQKKELNFHQQGIDNLIVEVKAI